MNEQEIHAIVKKQRAYFYTGATLNVDFRLAALKKLFAAPSAIIPPDGVTIIEKEIGSGKKVLAAASAGTLDTLEAWRKSMIGAPMMLPSPVLPDGYMWPDGTLASFEDWPELEEAYEAGKFEGYVLPASATDEDKKNYPGKWVLAANSAGLYTPRLTGLFARYCGQDGAGKYQEDAVQTGFVSITTRLLASQQEPLVLVSGNVSRISGTIMSVTASTASQGAYGYESQQRTADRTRPENVALPTALYLGRPAQV